MKIFIPFILGFLSAYPIFGQEQTSKYLSVLEAPDTWRSEFIPFPISFAPSIDFQGVEEVRFAQGWANKDSEEFWTYAFIWTLDKDPQLHEESLQSTIETYFNGLSQVVAKSKDDPTDLSLRPTTALFLKTPNNLGYIGKVHIYDAFFTQASLTLNAQVEKSFCQKLNKHLVFFKFSPLARNHKVWENFKDVRIKADCQE